MFKIRGKSKVYKNAKDVAFILKKDDLRHAKIVVCFDETEPEQPFTVNGSLFCKTVLNKNFEVRRSMKWNVRLYTALSILARS